MNASHPAVHPVEAPPLTDGAVIPAPRVRMEDIQGMPGTAGGLALRVFQFVFTVASLGIMVSASDFVSVTAFCYLVAAVILQSIWSLSLAMADLCALLVRRSLRNPRAAGFFTIGDGVTSTLTFAAACASAGITVLIAYLGQILPRVTHESLGAYGVLEKGCAFFSKSFQVNGGAE